jgi:adenosylhomocysteinase
VIAVNDAMTKHLFDNRYGTGQSTLDGIIRATNILLAGKTFVVGGYGWCSRGIAMRAKGLGANVVVTEIDPLKALEAVMDGFRVMPMLEAAPIGDIFCSATGDIHVFDGTTSSDEGRRHHGQLRPLRRGDQHQGAGGHEHQDHGGCAINLDEYTLNDGRRLYLAGEGRSGQPGRGRGAPGAVMDMSFANQALAAEYMRKHGHELAGRGLRRARSHRPGDRLRMKLKAMGVAIDVLTPEQAYLASWSLGTGH